MDCNQGSRTRKKAPFIDYTTFKIFYDGVPIAAQLYNQEGLLCLVNKAWETIWQARTSDVIGRYNILLDPQAQQLGLPRFFRQCLSGEFVEIPDFYYNPALSGFPGRCRWLHNTMYAVQDALSGEPYVVLINLDITEIKTNEEKYRLVFDNASDAISVVQDGFLKLVNRMVCELSGYSEAELLGRPFTDLVHPDDRTAVAANHERRLQGNHVPNQYQFRMVTRCGESRWLDASAVRIAWEGRPASMGFLRDITEQKTAYDALRESEERFRMIAETTRDMIHLNAADGRIIYANPATEKIMGYPLGEILDTTAFLHIHPEDQESIRQDMRQILQGQSEPTERDIRLRRKDGSFIDVTVRGFGWQHEGKPCLGAILRDISERKKAERQLADHARQIEEANITMKILLRQVTLAKEEQERTISDNITTLILPTLHELENRLADRPERAYVQAIKANISQLTAALPPQLSAQYLTLTPREQQVAELVRQGRTTKDIANLLGVSRRTVEYYRDTIRDKFGLKKRKMNLRAFLITQHQST